MTNQQSTDLQECIANRIIYNEDIKENVRISLSQDGSRLLFMQQKIRSLNTVRQLELFVHELENIQPLVNKMSELSWCDHRTALRLVDRKIINLGGKPRGYWEQI